jgi:spermidine/putrescine transport system substrate-binding protein
MKRKLPLFASLAILCTMSLPACQASSEEAAKSSTETVILNVYNSADYILEDETTTDENGKSVYTPGLVSQFETYCKETYGVNVVVNYSTFDTNETMLSELKTGKASYDLVCPSDYVVQKMIKEDMIEPFDEGSTPNYDKYVSRYVLDKINSIEVNGKTNVVGNYIRGYMWGTLGILYNDNYFALKNRGITAEEMDEDMKSWNSLWDSKYKNLLSIKDSVRDTYALGIFHTYDNDFVVDGKNYQGLSTLKELHDNGTLDDTEYNQKVTEIFNLCDDTTLNRVGDELVKLKANAFGFEVDSGKSDMVKGDKFAINLAWSGDAAYAMDLADEYNESGTIEGEEVEGDSKTANLKYVLPETGANIWFDGWVMPKGANKLWASRFVDFLSKPENAAANMEYIGYTPVIAGDAILEKVQSWYDERYDEETEEMDYDSIDINSDDFSEEYFTKDIRYFFEGTLEENDIDEAGIFVLSLDSKGKQFDTQYPAKEELPHLAVMADFGEQNASMLLMWESVKNTTLPTWAYFLILVCILLIISIIVFLYIRKSAIRKRRKERKLERERKSA